MTNGKYRIIRVHKKGFYTYYSVEQRFLLFLWYDNGRAFDSVLDAETWINLQSSKTTKEIVRVL